MRLFTVNVFYYAAIEIGFSSGSYSVSEGVGFVRVSVEITGQTDSDFAADISTWIGTAIGKSVNVVSLVVQRNNNLQVVRTTSHSRES